MATLKARRQANGSIRYTAIARKRLDKTIVHREARTFTHRSAALSCARRREVELENPAALTRKQHGPVALAELIRWHIETFETISKWQRSKQSHLEFLERHALGNADVVTLTFANGAICSSQKVEDIEHPSALTMQPDALSLAELICWYRVLIGLMR